VTTLPLAGRTVVVVHAAWHSCGSYQVNVGQVAAYNALGAHTISLAVREWPPGPLDLLSPRWRDYIEHTGDMPSHERFYTNAPPGAWARPAFWRDVYWPLIHGDHARSVAGMVAQAPVPAGLAGRPIDLVHCNHFFCLPAVEAMLAGRRAPILLETQDVQARQYDLRNDSLFCLPPRATYDDMLATELRWLEKADVLVHLNEDEARTFEQLLPRARNELVYPAVTPAPTGPGGRDIVIVASGNRPNTIGVIWFLEAVLPLVPDVPVRIYGNVDKAVAADRRDLYERHEALFAGRVEDIGAVYAKAGVVLLPTLEGHGLSIKAVEALSSGAALIATQHAFRGMQIEAERLRNVTIADDAHAFAQAMRTADALILDGPARAQSDTRRAYEGGFSAQAYAQRLAEIAVPLVSP
jgi:glycosyltransferase involved in cell wall biosynthesis